MSNLVVGTLVGMESRKTQAAWRINKSHTHSSPRLIVCVKNCAKMSLWARAKDEHGGPKHPRM